MVHSIIERIGMENIVVLFFIALSLIIFQLDRFSKNALRHIDDLQDRVHKLEKRLGIKEDFDIDPLGFTRSDENE